MSVGYSRALQFSLSFLPQSVLSFLNSFRSLPVHRPHCLFFSPRYFPFPISPSRDGLWSSASLSLFVLRKASVAPQHPPEFLCLRPRSFRRRTRRSSPRCYFPAISTTNKTKEIKRAHASIAHWCRFGDACHLRGVHLEILGWIRKRMLSNARPH